MNDAHRDSKVNPRRKDGEELPERPARAPSTTDRRRSLSMHEGIAVWCDCCSCEAEPYWVEAAEAMGIDPGSDYEDPER
ncbi:MAG: hypothetical protein U9Q81_09755 [Pseudomonadota bacterium]|nr:hypothetical protein [Pseudomonadota bacterium]